jgi:molecular chaperone GrpE
MSTEHDTTQPTSPGTESPGAGPASGAAGEPEAPTGPGPGSPRAADAAAAYATAEAHATPAEAQATPADANGTPGAPAPEDQPVSDDHERKLERDLEELAAKAEKADEYLELAKRTKADFENYRKRAAREAAAAQERGIAKLAKELLPAIDNLDRAVQAAEASRAPDAEQSNGHATLVSGVKLVHADVLAALQRAGIARFEPRGEQFDPQRHEAIAQQPVEGAAPGTIVEVYQQGYMLGEVVIRPARVVVAG